MGKSLLQNDKYCIVCGTSIDIQYHHIYFGVANRRLSDEDGCTCYICMAHHTGILGVHHNRELDIGLKQLCQNAWQEHYNKTTDDFIKRYGKNYL